MNLILQREHRDKCREHDQLKRATVKLKEDLEMYKAQLEERDRLIQVCLSYLEVEQTCFTCTENIEQHLLGSFHMSVLVAHWDKTIVHLQDHIYKHL
jgi:hypothetical protein